jgi:hypothetical protein
MVTFNYAHDTHGSLGAGLIDAFGRRPQRHSEAMILSEPPRDNPARCRSARDDLFNNGDAAAVTALNAAFAKNGQVPLDTSLACEGGLTDFKAVVTSGDPDLPSFYLGSFRGNTLPSFESPVSRQATNSLVRVG